MNTHLLSGSKDRDWAMDISALVQRTPEEELKVKNYQNELLRGNWEAAESDVEQRDLQIKGLQEENDEMRQQIKAFQELASRSDPPNERLIEEYNRYMGPLWDKIARKIGVPAKFIEERYWLVGLSQLDPYQEEIRRASNWTEEEDRALVKKSLDYPKQWAQIGRELSDEFPESQADLSRDGVRVRMNTLLCRRSWPWSPRDKQGFERAYMEEAPEFWTQIGQSFRMNDREAETMYNRHRELFLKG